MDKYLMNLHRFTLAFLLLAAIVVTACNKSSPTASAAADTLSASGGDAQQGIVAQQLQSPLIVQVSDAGGNTVAGVTVTWAITTGGGSLSSATATSDANGRAEVLWTAGTAAGSASATASIDGGATVTFHATLVADLPASLMKVSGDNQIGPDGAALSPFVVEAVDQYGNPVAGVLITWTDSAGGALNATATMTDASGMAQDVLTTDPAPEAYSVSASANGLAPIVFFASSQ